MPKLVQEKKVKTIIRPVSIKEIGVITFYPPPNSGSVSFKVLQGTVNLYYTHTHKHMHAYAYGIYMCVYICIKHEAYDIIYLRK